jgi:hypothetical protein
MDALLVIDDYVPGGNQQRINEMSTKADRVFRGVGNRSARGRMSAEGRLRPDYPPRGSVLSTGEEIPPGQSLRARSAVVELAAGDVNLPGLTKAQAAGADGAFATAMAGCVRWIASVRDDLGRSIDAELRALRAAALASGTAHARTPEVTANLAYGWKTFLAYCFAVGAIDARERAAWWRRAWIGLCTLAGEQASIQRAEDPVRRYLELVQSALSSRQAHVANMEDHQPTRPTDWGWDAVPVNPTSDDGRTYTEYTYRPQGTRIGWTDGATLYLLPEASLAAVQKIATPIGAPIPLSVRTLGRRLKQRGALAEVEQQGYTVRRVVGGAKNRTFAISLDYIHAQTSGTSGIDEEKPRADAENPVPDVELLSGTMPDVYPAPKKHPAPTGASPARENPDVPDVPDVYEGIPPGQECVACALDTLRAWHAGGALTALPDPIPGLPADLADYATPERLFERVPRILDSAAYSVTAQERAVQLVAALAPILDASLGKPLHVTASTVPNDRDAVSASRASEPVAAPAEAHASRSFDGKGFPRKGDL